MSEREENSSALNIGDRVAVWGRVGGVCGGGEYNVDFPCGLGGLGSFRLMGVKAGDIARSLTRHELFDGLPAAARIRELQAQLASATECETSLICSSANHIAKYRNERDRAAQLAQALKALLADSYPIGTSENAEVREQARAALLAADGALGASTPGADGEAGSTGRSPDPIPTEGREPNQ